MSERDGGGRQFGKKPFSEIPVDAPTDKGASKLAVGVFFLSRKYNIAVRGGGRAGGAASRRGDAGWGGN